MCVVGSMGIILGYAPWDTGRRQGWKRTRDRRQGSGVIWGMGVVIGMPSGRERMDRTDGARPRCRVGIGSTLGKGKGSMTKVGAHGAGSTEERTRFARCATHLDPKTENRYRERMPKVDLPNFDGPGRTVRGSMLVA